MSIRKLYYSPRFIKTLLTKCSGFCVSSDKPSAQQPSVRLMDVLLAGGQCNTMKEIDYVYEVAKNPLLAYTMLHVIDKFPQSSLVAPDILTRLCKPVEKRSKEHRTLTPSRFYRILYLIQQDCQARGCELKLPYYWYKSGPVVYARAAPRVFTVTRVKKTQQITTSFDQWKDTILVFHEHESAYSDAILLTEKAEKLAEFSKLDVIYEYSPSQVHKILLILLNELNRIKKRSKASEKHKDRLLRLVDRLAIENQKTEHPDLQSPFAVGVEVLQRELTGGFNIERINGITADLWDFFTLALRAKENTNIDQNTVQIWDNKYLQASKVFEKRFSK